MAKTLWAEFSTLELAICKHGNFGVMSKTAYLKVDNSAKTISRFSPVSYSASRLRESRTIRMKVAKTLYFQHQIVIDTASG